MARQAADACALPNCQFQLVLFRPLYVPETRTKKRFRILHFFFESLCSSVMLRIVQEKCP